ncbi:hypothetical protein PsYK624_106680 [Phanerochaete sordida]|uniref:Uncharacterized protein n=1 Tax=Phanerochaete sordida TaxID=48140 RepID=A0A9P3LH29_9APHY|nr:hypothetical protein PsYK624_106680 [Phanerochaete sordida]
MGGKRDWRSPADWSMACAGEQANRQPQLCSRVTRCPRNVRSVISCDNSVVRVCGTSRAGPTAFAPRVLVNDGAAVSVETRQSTEQSLSRLQRSRSLVIASINGELGRRDTSHVTRALEDAELLEAVRSSSSSYMSSNEPRRRR